MIRFFGSLDKLIEKFASYVLVGAVMGMLFMSIANIVLRWFNLPINWFDPFIRHLVFLSAFLGGVLATGRKTHIGIDIIGKYLESKQMWTAHKNVGRVIAIASLCTLVWLTMACWDYVLVEVKYGKPHFLGIHSKFLVSIIPIGFGMIAYRFFFLFLSSFFEDETPKEHPQTSEQEGL